MHLKQGLYSLETFPRPYSVDANRLDLQIFLPQPSSSQGYGPVPPNPACKLYTITFDCYNDPRSRDGHSNAMMQS